MIEHFTNASPDLAAGVSAASMAAYAFFGLCGKARLGATSALPYYHELQALDQINEIAELNDGWAGDGSLAPTERIISWARYISINLLSDVPFADIAAMPNGTIAFDWDTSEGTANLEIGDTHYSFYLSLIEDRAFIPLSGVLEEMPLSHLSYYISSFLAPNSRLEDHSRSTTTAMYSFSVERPIYAAAAA